MNRTIAQVILIAIFILKEFKYIFIAYIRILNYSGGMNIQKICEALIESGLTQQKIANELDCSQTAVCQMLQGVSGCKNPTVKICEGLRRICKKRRIAWKDL